MLKDLSIFEGCFAPDDILIIDNLLNSFALQPQNGIPIFPFEGSKEDRELKYLIKVILDIDPRRGQAVAIREELGISDMIEYCENNY